MRLFNHITLLILASFCTICLGPTIFADASLPAKQTQYYTLDNGMQVILKEQHGAPMIASVIFVQSGSKYESRFENGITHFLEHLLFDGTTNKSRQEIDESIRDLGGYINAFTRKDMTSYLVLVPRQFIDYGMTVQADMLFNSTIPEDELAKERKVVIEEINRDLDSPGYVADAFFTDHAYAHTPYQRPVLGYKAFINNIPRDAIVDYWKRYYRPENMTIMAIGDFESDQMRPIIEKVFGSIPNPDVPAAKTPVDKSGDYALHGQQRFDTVASVTSTYVNFSIDGPRYDHPDYPAFDLLTRYLGMDEASPLIEALKSGGKPLAEQVSVDLDTRPEFTRMDLSIITKDADNVPDILRLVKTTLESMDTREVPKETVDGIKVSNRTQDIYMSERLHYYAFIIAPMMALGYPFVERYPDLFDAVRWVNCQAAARHWLDSANYVVTVVRPPTDSLTPKYTPESLSDEEVVQYFDTATFAGQSNWKPVDIEYPSTETINFEWKETGDYRREVLPNGLVCLVKSSPESRVFAMNVLGKNRTANEPEGKEGITDFDNHMIEKGTVNHDASQLATALSEIGANVTLYDNPWIPYDDRYTTRRFSFMKFETIDTYARTGFDLFSEMLLTPAFDSVQVEQVRGALLGALGRSAGSPSKIAKQLFYETLFEGTSFARPIEGDARSIASISVDDLRAFHKHYYAPNNIILSIVSNVPADTILAWVKARYGDLPKSDAPYKELTVIPPVTQPEEQTASVDSKQAAIYLGGSTFGLKDSDAVALEVATSILSNRLFSNLRERKGLAYSVGAGVTLDRTFGWYLASMGVSPENQSDARDGMLLEIEKLRLDGPLDSEVSRARNQLWGHLMSAKLASINQAYYLGLDEFLGLPPKYDQTYLAELSGVDARAVRRAAARAFNTMAYVMATAGPIE